MPTVRKTWAPRGQTPVLHAWFRHDRLSVISAVSVSPRRRHLGLSFHLQATNLRVADVCAFLRHLLRHLRGPVLVLWDGGRIHRGRALDRLQARCPRLRVERLPAYAPDLNPDEGVWTLAKRGLANGRPDDLPTLARRLRGALRRVRRSQRLLHGCVAQSDLPLFLP